MPSRSTVGLLGAAASAPTLGQAFVAPSSHNNQENNPTQQALRAGAGSRAAAPSLGQSLATATPLGLAGLAAVALAAGRRAKRSSKASGLEQPFAAATALRAFEEDLGIQPPTGFWDPAGYVGTGDAFDLYRRRCVEIKHGRVSMLACIGYIVPEYFKFPGFISPSTGLKFENIPNGLAAVTKVPALGWFQVVFFCGQMELFGVRQFETEIPGAMRSGAALGGYVIDTRGKFFGIEWGPFGLPNAPHIADPAVRKKKLQAEIANGRLAMVSIIGMFFQDGLTGSAWGDWSLYTDSPLRAYENETGVQAPLGFWDPLGLAASGNNFDYKRRREVEIKHGRVSMFATIGYIVPEYYKFPGYISPSYNVSFNEIPNGLGAFSKVPALGLCQIVGFAGFLEVQVFNEQVNDEPGNYGSGFLGCRSIGFMSPGWKDPEARKKKLNAELANGRLAMVAIIGMFFQDGLTGSAWGDWNLYTESPLRAFEDEIGVQPPVGFWDPLGLAADGDKEAFKRRRAVEIKHGRVSMYACIGYFTPEYGKFSGYLSPSQDLKFSDIPNGLAAISKVPLVGWAQIIAFCGVVEVTGFFQPKRGRIGWMQDASMTSETGEPGNYGLGWIGAFNKLKPIPVLRKRKLNSELANGRLAMTAIMAMIFQNGTFGTTGPEMWTITYPEYAQTVGDFIPKNI